MKADRILGLAFVGMVAVFTVSCRGDNNDNRTDYYGDDDVVVNDTLGDGRVADGRVDDRERDVIGDGRVGDDRLGDGRIGDDRLGDGRIGDDKLGDGRIGDDKLGDGKIGPDDDNARVSSSSSGRALIIAGNWRVREDVNGYGADESFESTSFRFNSGNTFSLSTATGTRNGTWSYNGSTLSLRYDGDAAASSFRVLELNEDRMRLQASDGSELTLLDHDK